MQVKYSILQYYPTYLSDQHMNLGIAFCDIEAEKISFISMLDKKVLEKYDPEVDSNVVEMLLIGIKNELEGIERGSVFALQSFIRYYINELKFTEPDDFYGESRESIIGDLKNKHF